MQNVTAPQSEAPHRAAVYMRACAAQCSVVQRLLRSALHLEEVARISGTYSVFSFDQAGSTVPSRPDCMHLALCQDSDNSSSVVIGDRQVFER